MAPSDAREKDKTTWKVKRNQPMAGIEHEAVEEIVGYWVGGKDEKYHVTDRWKVLKAKEGGGTKVFDIHWHSESSTIRWGDEFFFDPVELYNSIDTVRWFSTDDPERTKIMHEWNRSETPLEGFEEHRSVVEKERVTRSENPRGTRTRGKLLKSDRGEREVAVMYWSEGGLEVNVGDVLKVTSVQGLKVEFEAADEVHEEETWHDPTLSKSQRKKLKKKTAKEDSSRTAKKTLPTKSENAISKSKVSGTQPSDGYGAEVLEHITGIWDGSRGETYTLTDKWQCTKTDRKGNPHVFRNITWDDESQRVLWGQSFIFDAADLESVQESGELHWYRQRDHEKKKAVYTWTRQE